MLRDIDLFDKNEMYVQIQTVTFSTLNSYIILVFLFFFFFFQVTMCDYVICENGAQCQQDLNTADCYKCMCPAGFTGKVCETPIAILRMHHFCLSRSEQSIICFIYFLAVGCSPGCQNNGFCNNNVCICPTGYSGTFCEIRGMYISIHFVDSSLKNHLTFRYLFRLLFTH
jgi:hypothetical protein